MLPNSRATPAIVSGTNTSSGSLAPQQYTVSSGSTQELFTSEASRTDLGNVAAQFLQTNDGVITAPNQMLASSLIEEETSLNDNVSLRHLHKNNHQHPYVISSEEDHNKSGNVIDLNVTYANYTRARFSLAGVNDLTHQVQCQEQKEWFCFVCGRQFASAWTLREHNRVHTGGMRLKVISDGILMAEHLVDIIKICTCFR